MTQLQQALSQDAQGILKGMVHTEASFTHDRPEKQALQNEETQAGPWHARQSTGFSLNWIYPILKQIQKHVTINVIL